MAEKSPAFQWYPKDILSSRRVAIMTLAEEAAYRRAIDFCWLHGSLPADLKQLAMMIGKGCTVKIAAVVKAMFFETNGELRHDRLDQERDKQKEFSERQKERADKRWNKSGIAENDATALPRHKKPHCENDALHLQSSSSSPKNTIIQTPAGDEKKKPDKKPVEEIKVELPWPGEEFSAVWQKWKAYRAQEKRTKFKTPESELAQLKHLHGLAFGDEQTAIKIIEQSIGNQWTGLFQIKNNGGQNGPQNITPKTPLWRQ